MTQGDLDFSASSAGDDPAANERVLIAPGPRAAEALLLREIARDLAETRRDPARLRAPLRVIVPSRSLREHVAARIAQEHGGAAGVVVQTLRGLCHELLRGEEPLRSGDALAPVVTRRAAAQSPVLREALALLDDGFGVVEASVRDLLDAGLTPENAEAALEALADVSGGARARAVIDVALAAARELAALGLAPRSALFARAAERVRSEGVRARAIWIHGYADVTGVQLDVIEALVRACGARVVLDRPPDPTALPGDALGSAFSERLRLRLGAGSALACGPVAPAQLTLMRAAGAAGEVRAVAERVREALAGGEAPESVAIVARDLTPYRFALGTQLRRLAIPFSGGEGFLDPAGRRIAALLAWLEQGARTPADVWLEAHGALADADDLRVAFHGIGAGRLGDVASLDVAALLETADDYVLPVRRAHTLVSEGDAASAREGDDADEDESEREAAPRAEKLAAHRRKVKRARLEHAVLKAQSALEAHAALSATQPLAHALAQLISFAMGELAWHGDAPGRSELAAACGALEEGAPPDFALSGDELRVLLRRALRGAGVAALGGSGGGVRVLNVTEARARTFGRVFVLGANRDVFPRPFSEDALLPDAVRAKLEAALPDIPIKRRAVDEDRYLFAQLASAAPHVHISWQGVSDDGKERPASPLVSRLEAPSLEVASAGIAWEARASGPLPAHEHALRLGLAGAHERAAQAQALALGDAPASAARRAALAELDAPPSSARLGPFYGFVGDRTDAREPSVSRLEGAVRCGWQLFLEHILGLEPPVDALAALPEITGLLLGNVVHGALEELATAAGAPGGITLDAARAREPVSVPWPRGEAAQRVLLAAAQRVAREEGVVLPGFAELLARRAREVFERVGEVDWPGGAPRSVLGVEVDGTRIVEGAGERIAVRFRADRVDRAERAGDALDLTDYKTGKPFTSAADAGKRTSQLRKRVKAGALLQGAAYALSVGGEGRGRYLYARPDEGADRAEVVIHADAELASAFDDAVTTIVRAWRAGAFVPRLANYGGTDEGKACANCRVAESCLRGDTTARLRLAEWRDRGAEGAEPEAAARALLALGKAER